MYQAIFYWDEKDRVPVKELLDSLSQKTKQKIASWIDLLEQEGPHLRRPYADKVKDKLYELRIRFGFDNIRILYFFFLNDKIVLLHGFRKKDWEIKPNDLELAERRMEDFIHRFKLGKIRLNR